MMKMALQKRHIFILVPIFLLFVLLLWSSSSSSITTTTTTTISSSDSKERQQQRQKQDTVIVEKETDPEMSSRCLLRSNTFRDLGQFPFWGQIMNSSFPCVASGMNNQLTLLLAYWHCFDNTHRKEIQKMQLKQQVLGSHHQIKTLGFRWKDITCSPTGGKEGHRRFVLGSSDYGYAWFRWSEVFKIHLIPTWLKHKLIYDQHHHQQQHDYNKKNKKKQNKQQVVADDDVIVKSTLCLHDKYSWNEHLELRKCPSNIGKLYGSKRWWHLRGRLEPYQRYTIFVRCFFEIFASTLDNDSLDSDSSSDVKKEKLDSCFEEKIILEQKQKEKKSSNKNKKYSNMTTFSSYIKELVSQQVLVKNVVGIHVRRGDYANFCKGLTGSRGIQKFRVPPFKWLATHNSISQTLSSKFPDTCAPSDSKVIFHVKNITTTLGNQNNQQQQANDDNNMKKKRSSSFLLLFVSSNSPSFVKEVKNSFNNTNENTQQPQQQQQEVKVVTLNDVTKIYNDQWPEILVEKKTTTTTRSSIMSITDKVMLDIVALAISEIVVLNRYSTFSQSVVDERTLRAATSYFDLKNKHNHHRNNNNDSDDDDDDAGENFDFRTLPTLNGIKWW